MNTLSFYFILFCRRSCFRDVLFEAQVKGLFSIALKVAKYFVTVHLLVTFM